MELAISLVPHPPISLSLPKHILPLKPQKRNLPEPRADQLYTPPGVPSPKPSTHCGDFTNRHSFFSKMSIGVFLAPTELY